MATLRIALGCLSLAAFMLLFAAGLSFDSAPYRARLSVGSGATVGAAVGGTAAPPAASPSAADEPVWRAFVLVMLLYTPLNVAFLTMIAAFVGGCASNLTFEQASKKAGGLNVAAQDMSPTRILFRTESPFASMFRGFTVYLAFMAGIFVTTANPFASPTAEQYVRLAATLALTGFAVGYDPTKFPALLRLPSARADQR